MVLLSQYMIALPTLQSLERMPRIEDLVSPAEAIDLQINAANIKILQQRGNDYRLGRTGNGTDLDVGTSCSQAVLTKALYFERSAPAISQQVALQSCPSQAVPHLLGLFFTSANCRRFRSSKRGL